MSTAPLPEASTRSETILPKPLAAYLGLLAASLEDVRGTGRGAVAQVAHLPLATLSQLLTARQRYDELALQGDVIADVVVGIVRGQFRTRQEEAQDDDWLGGEFAEVTSLVSEIPIEAPLAGYDHMTGPQLRGRLRTLDRVQLAQLLDYERSHQGREAMILLLENRLTKLNAASS